MKLIIGGFCQGKTACAEKMSGQPSEYFTDGATATLEELYQAAVIDHFHTFIKRTLKEGRSTETLAQKLYRQNPEAVIVTDEVGYGIVPMDPFERTYREACGRVCTALASNAEEVYRVTCGIAVKLK